MAAQMHVAYSALFRGAAIYAGGPDGCALGSVATALSSCSYGMPPIDVAGLESTVQDWAARGLIDPLQNLRGQPVYLWAGQNDSEVLPAVTDALQAFYAHFGVDVFRYDSQFAAEHGWESPDGPVKCDVKASPYVIACGASDLAHQPGSRAGDERASGTGAYDSEEVWLTRWFGPLNPRNNGHLRGKLMRFDQGPFAPRGDAAAISLASHGYAFIPENCAGGSACGLVLALHGCLQSYDAVGAAFIERAGINEWADSNSIVVVYPQTTAYPPSFTDPGNPLGCWNWWGYLNDHDYDVKSGPQMRALFGMVAQAAGLHSHNPAGNLPQRQSPTLR